MTRPRARIVVPDTKCVFIAPSGINSDLSPGIRNRSHRLFSLAGSPNATAHWSAISSLRSTSRALGIVLLALGCLLAVSCSRAASSKSHDGTIIGSIRRGGGPGGMPHPRLGGTVTVFNSRGTAIARATVGKGRQFHFRLAPGHYRLNFGTRVFDSRNGCQPASAVLRPSASVHVQVGAGCSIS